MPWCFLPTLETGNNCNSTLNRLEHDRNGINHNSRDFTGILTFNLHTSLEREAIIILIFIPEETEALLKRLLSEPGSHG